jgi:uncharacterized protein (DUF427 family)
MSLTRGGGPLVAKDPPESNYEIVGPRHRILWGEFPRRVRGELAGETVLDTTAGRLLHESQILPVLYVPEADVAAELLVPTGTHTTCPFKGEASYWSIRVGDRVAEDAVWSYPEPLPEAPWLRGHLAFYWDKLDAWFDEDERVFGHLRDPFHRVDIRPTSRRATVTVRGEVIAESRDAKVLSETGLPNRIYLPMADIPAELLEPSEKTSICPYKGEASHWSVRAGDGVLEDAAFSYPEPLEGTGRIAGHVCFLHEDVKTVLEG